MTCGGEEVGWVPASARTTGGEGERTVREQPLRVVCQPGGRDGSPPPVFTGAGSRREDNGGGAGIRVGGRGSVLGGEIPRLRFAALRMTCGGEEVGWVPAPRLHGGRISTRGQRGGAGRAVREQPLPDGCQTGGRDGSPPPVFTGAGSRREDNGGERGGRFANSPYQMVVRRVGGMGPRPPSSRGQDLDARTTGGWG